MQISFFVGIFANNMITKRVVISCFPMPQCRVLSNEFMDI